MTKKEYGTILDRVEKGRWKDGTKNGYIILQFETSDCYECYNLKRLKMT